MTPKIDINKLSTEMAVVSTKIDNINTTVSSIQQKLEADYVTQDQFEPVKKVVYGLVSVILLTVFGALLALVVTK